MGAIVILPPCPYHENGLQITNRELYHSNRGSEEFFSYLPVFAIIVRGCDRRYYNDYQLLHHHEWLKGMIHHNMFLSHGNHKVEIHRIYDESGFGGILTMDHLFHQCELRRAQLRQIEAKKQAEEERFQRAFQTWKQQQQQRCIIS